MTVRNMGLNVAGLRSNFFSRFDATETHFLDLATRMVSDNDAETYRWLGTTPKMREWGTGRLAQGLRTESYIVENLKYEVTMEVDRDEIADDKTGQIMIRVHELAQRAAVHKDFLISQLLRLGADTGFNSYDGVTFFNNAHVSGDSGNQDNDLAAPAAAATKTTAEFKAALQAAIGQMLGFKDDRGDPTMMSMSGLVCVVPPTMVFPALEATEAEVIGSTSNVAKGVARVLSSPWLTDATKWYLLKTDGVVRPFIFQDREPIEFAALASGSEEEFKREKHLYGARGRYRLTYGLWQDAVRTTFAN